jgi:hypothetical protein
MKKNKLIILFLSILLIIAFIAVISCTTASNTDGNSGGGGTSSTNSSGGSSSSAPSAYVYFIKQTNGTASAGFSSSSPGTINVIETYAASGNAFKFVTPNYYGTNSNAFLAFPTAMSGDFSISAKITVTARNKTTATMGIALGMTTGFNPTDLYAYMQMAGNLATNSIYVSGFQTVSTGSPTSTYTQGSTYQLSFSRTGSNCTYGIGPDGGSLTTNTVAASTFTDGTNVFGTGSVYPCVSWNNCTATITSLVIKDASNTTVFDSATGYITTPASLTLSSNTASMNRSSSASVTATALAIGGAVASVTAVAADPTVVDV